jgi:hypothetical protein
MNGSLQEKILRLEDERSRAQERVAQAHARNDRAIVAVFLAEAKQAWARSVLRWLIGPQPSWRWLRSFAQEQWPGVRRNSGDGSYRP